VVVRAIGQFKVFEDAAFELVNMREAFFAHQDRCLLAPDASGAEAHHGLVLIARVLAADLSTDPLPTDSENAINK